MSTFKCSLFISAPHLSHFLRHESTQVSRIDYNNPRESPCRYLNDKPLALGARHKTVNDFGFAALDISDAKTEDSGVYMLKVFNARGEATTRCKLTVSVSCTCRVFAFAPIEHTTLLEARTCEQSVRAL